MTNKKILTCFYFLITVIIIISVYIFIDFDNDNVAIDSENVKNFDDNWVYHNNGNYETIHLPAILDVKKDEELIISNTLPTENILGMTLCLRTSQQKLRVIINNKEVYKYGIDNVRSFGKSPGSAWHFIRIPDESRGKEIKLVISSPYEANAGKINTITYGSKNSNLFNILRKHLLSFFICLAVFSLGLILVLVSIATKKELLYSKILLYLGLFAMCASVWSSIETRVLQLWLGNQFFNNFIATSALQICPIPILMFFKELYGKEKEKSYAILAGMFLINYAVTLVLQLGNIADLNETLNSTFFLIVLSLIFILYKTVKDLLFSGDREKTLFAVNTIIFAVFICLDFINYFLNVFGDRSYFFRLGLMYYIYSLAIISSKRIFRSMAQSLENKVLTSMAYTDMLTNIKNRTAFEKTMEEFMQKQDEVLYLGIVMFDLNNLKMTNDTLGHKSGDEIIIKSSEFIKASFEKYGEAYRIGGDEFVVIMENVDICVINLCLSECNKMIYQYNSSNDTHKIDIAYGYAIFDDKLDKDVYAVFNRADANMYEDKKIKKSRCFGN